MGDSCSSRETRDWARELKFLIDERQAPAVREWARARLAPNYAERLTFRPFQTALLRREQEDAVRAAAARQAY